MKIRPRVLFVLVVSLVGCTGEIAGSEEEEEEENATAEDAQVLVSENALTENALDWNGISLNGISLNGISLNALQPGALTAAQYSGLTDPGPTGDLVRMNLSYTVGCALATNQSFSFQYTDSAGVLQHVTYKGELGLAPAWASGPLNDQGQRMVTACLVARVNYYGVHVLISMRSVIEPLKSSVTSKELTYYPDVEGAFWGNLFDPNPYLFSCYNDATIVNSRSHKRDCAAGHLVDGTNWTDCGPIHIVGSCSKFCQPLTSAGQYYPSCVEKPGVAATTTKSIITTALP